MTKIKCNTLSGSVDCQTYKTPKGTEYTFYKGQFTNVNNPEDALFFLNAGKEPLFSADKPLEKIKKILIDAVKMLKKKDKVDEENAPEETGVLEPNAEDLEALDGDDAPVDGDDDNTESEEKTPEKVFTHESLKELNAKEQTFMIKQCQGPDAKIPRYEKNKIALLLKLQKEGADLVEIQKGYQP